MLQRSFILIYFFLDTTIIIFSYCNMKHTFTLKGQFCTSSLWTAEWIRIWNMEQLLPILACVNSPYPGVLLTSVRFMIHFCISDVGRTDLKTFLEQQLALFFVLVTMRLQAWSPFQLVLLFLTLRWQWQWGESLCFDLRSSALNNGIL